MRAEDRSPAKLLAEILSNLGPGWQLHEEPVHDAWGSAQWVFKIDSDGVKTYLRIAVEPFK